MGRECRHARPHVLEAEERSKPDLPAQESAQFTYRTEQLLILVPAAVRDVRDFQSIAEDGSRQFVGARTGDEWVAGASNESGVAREYPGRDPLHDEYFHLDIVTISIRRRLKKLGALRIRR